MSACSLKLQQPIQRFAKLVISLLVQRETISIIYLMFSIFHSNTKEIHSKTFNPFEEFNSQDIEIEKMGEGKGVKMR